jgi:hypothetical protein
MSATLVRTELPNEPARRPKLADRLSRRTSSGRYMPEVDGVRFLAIGIVVAVHLVAAGGLSSGRLVIVPPFGPILARSSRDPASVGFLQYGHVGVYLFFILSGFVLALPFIRWRVMGARRIALSAYFLRRVTRIEPPFIIVAIGLFLLSIALHEPSTTHHLAATLTYFDEDDGIAFFQHEVDLTQTAGVVARPQSKPLLEKECKREVFGLHAIAIHGLRPVSISADARRRASWSRLVRTGPVSVHARSAGPDPS